MELKGSRTEKNLMTAFAGESQARNQYTYYAGVAKKAGYEQIASIFQETADNEKEHAKIFFKLLKGSTVEINAAFPSHLTDNTAENLKAAAAGENMEWTELYPNAAQIAKEEGFTEVEVAFTQIAKVEKVHEKRYQTLVKNLEGDMVFQKAEVVKWHCRNCGLVYEGKAAPKVCPTCKHPLSYFEILAENY